MKFLKYIVTTRLNEAIQVILDKQANVKVMNQSNVDNYQNHRRY